MGNYVPYAARGSAKVRLRLVYTITRQLKTRTFSAVGGRTRNAYIGSDASLSPAEARHQHSALTRAHRYAGVRDAASEEQCGARGWAQHKRIFRSAVAPMLSLCVRAVGQPRRSISAHTASLKAAMRSFIPCKLDKLALAPATPDSVGSARLPFAPAVGVGLLKSTTLSDAVRVAHVVGSTGSASAC